MTVESAVAFRSMGEGDLDEVLSIEEASFATPWSRPTFERLLRHGAADAVVAVRGEAVVGYAVYWRVRDEAELGNLAVHPSHRRRGIATRLLEEVVGSVRRDGAAAVYLEVRESNEAARALYEGEGFRAVGRRRGYYRSPAEDALVLRRAFESAVPGESPSTPDR